MKIWAVGDKFEITEADINVSDDKRSHIMEYIGEGLLRDIDSGRRVAFSEVLFPKLFEGMVLQVGLEYNPRSCETFKVVRVLGD